ncbi:hypothetical protein CC1G_07495 [Coprinopsis cinerea okayama7|uniref:Uncharacterized protein n=1 Tax=Coprinopsis cinerea (strain Okayama-7 / 130 / ATCC MYA-4618 / FGSC 9003) TaxID=240176 RepID=A8P117_COPC7|nr:hypothetical protein CC1G_07495 [Coprinopsis cinerea okayama7\|eukprot:XP_001838005.2 hypothetical protein CC1G_07495 [Coprinopsis cinerea okayama7\
MPSAEVRADAFIDRLAPETLALIFEEALPPKHQISILPSTYPCLLTTVSREWRAIAQTTPQLWSTIHIDLPVNVNPNQFRDGPAISKYENYLVQRGAAVERWLTHAGNSRVSVTFKLTNQGLDNISFYIRNLIFRLMMEVLDRVCSARFTQHSSGKDNRRGGCGGRGACG